MDGVTGIFLPKCLFYFVVASEDPSTLAVGVDREIYVAEFFSTTHTFLDHD